MDDLVKRLRERASGVWGPGIPIEAEAADRIAALEKDVQTVLRREQDANRAAMKHLRALEKERIKARNYADFNHEWRERCQALEARVAAADKLAKKAKAQHDKFLTWAHKPDAKKALKSLDADADFLDALAAYEASKEQSDG